MSYLVVCRAQAILCSWARVSCRGIRSDAALVMGPGELGPKARAPEGPDLVGPKPRGVEGPKPKVL